MANKTVPGIINYSVSCKHCEWRFDTDSTSKLTEATQQHRKKHWYDSPAGILQAKKEAREREMRRRVAYRMILLEKKTDAYTEMQLAKRSLDNYKATLAEADKLAADRDRIVEKIGDMEERIEECRIRFANYEKMMENL